MARQRLTLRLDVGAGLRRPLVEVAKVTVRPRAGMPALDALLAVPSGAAGVLAYFPGFNTPLGKWEAAKCRVLADVSGLAVVVCEIPGLSCHRDPIPRAVRQDMRRGQVGSWAELAFWYFAAALRELPGLPVQRVLGYSTGCSLAVAGLPALGGVGKLEVLALVEPVAITRRSLGVLTVDNVADFARLPAAQRTNRSQPWVMEIKRGGLGEAAVHYSLGDFHAIAKVLCANELPDALASAEVPRVGLARGVRSSLCPGMAFAELHGGLEAAGVPGVTLEVPGLGHQMWHSFPALAGVAGELLAGGTGPGEASPPRE